MMMKIRGEIIKRPFSGAEIVDFYVGDLLTAKLTLGFKERWRDIYKLTCSETEEEAFPVTTIKTKGLINRKFWIQVVGQDTTWVYGRERWYDFMYGKMILITHDEKFEISISDEKIDVYKNELRIGTARKVYDSIFDKGEYNISFESKNYMRLFLILGSILIIDTEVIKSRGHNMY